MKLEPVLVRKERFSVGGLKRRFNLQENREHHLLPKLYGEWGSRRGELAQAADGRTIGVEIYPADQTEFDPERDRYDFLAGAELTVAGDGDLVLPEGMDSFVAEAGIYAVFTHKGNLSDIREFHGAIYQEWLPKHMYARGAYAMEVYDERFLGPYDDESVMEVWVPVTYTKPPHCGSFQNGWTTAAQSLLGAIKFTDKRDRTLLDIMGYTGHAFRIAIHEETVDPGGPTAWDWGPVFADTLQNMGIRASYIGAPNYTPPTPELLEQAIAKVQRSVDRGIPAIAWDLFIPEFGVIFGYDDEKMELHAKDVSREGTLPYQKLGRGQAGELFVLTLDELFEVDKKTALVGALRRITEHARVRDRFLSETQYYNGLAAYEAWIRAFRGGKVNVFGNGYNAAVVCDARAYAAQFMRNVQRQWNGDSAEEREVARLAGEAAEHYRAVFEALVQLPPLYPFPQGGNPNLSANADHSISILQQAWAAEERGVEKLERMLDVLR